MEMGVGGPDSGEMGWMERIWGQTLGLWGLWGEWCGNLVQCKFPGVYECDPKEDSQ